MSELYAGYNKFWAKTKITIDIWLTVFVSFILIFLVAFFAVGYFTVATNDAINLFSRMVSWTISNTPLESKFTHFSALTDTGEKIRYSVSSYAENPVMTKSFDRITPTLWINTGLSCLLSTLLNVVYFSFLRRYFGKNLEDGKYLRGAQHIDEFKMLQLIRDRDQLTSFPIGNVTIPVSKLNRHMGFFGDTGAGKSQTIMPILDAARAADDKAIIVDKTGEYVQHYYDPEKDKILSPFDERSVGWSPFNEGEELFDFERLAQSFIPTSAQSSGKDDHWAEASVTVFSTLLYELKRREECRSVDDIISLLIESTKTVVENELGDEVIVRERGINRILKGTMAELVVDVDAPDHAASVIATIIPKIKALYHIRGLEEREQFSIRDWVKDETAQGWVFIRVTEDQLAASRSLITAWVDLFVKSMLSLPKSSTRCVHALVDELGSFDKIESLPVAASEGRKHGLRLMLGFTSTGQLVNKYGRDVTQAMLSMLGTKAVFVTSEPETAKWCADLLGEEDTKLSSSNVSTGTNDNVNFGDDRRRQHVVMPSEIQALPDLHFYLKFSGNWPSTRTSTQYIERPTVAEPMIPRELPAPYITALAEDDELCEGDAVTDDVVPVI